MKSIDKYCLLCNAHIENNTADTYSITYGLCNNCKNRLKNNIILIAISESPLYDNQISAKTNRNLYLTGKYAIITKDTLNKTIIPSALKDYIEKHKIIFIYEDALTKLLSFDTSLIKNNERIKNNAQNIS